METIKAETGKSKLKGWQKSSCRMVVLSPVHVGSGLKLLKDIDFIASDYATFIISQSELMNHLRENKDEFDRFAEGNYLLSSLKKMPKAREYMLRCYSREILEFERDGNAKPYVPGTSIKGAIRTALFRHFLSNLSQKERDDLFSRVRPGKKEWASDPVMKAVFGSSPNVDLFKVLRIGDAYFSERDLNLETSYVLNLKAGETMGFGWKNIIKRFDSSNPREATPIYAEMLQKESSSVFSVKIEDFFFENQLAKNRLRFETKRFDLKCLAAWINNYSREKICSEIAFFSELNKKDILTQLIKELKNIEQQIPKAGAPEDTNSFVLRLGWGTSWKNMTGDAFDEKTMLNFRRMFNLGRSNYPFPKTRKVIFDGDKAAYISGWIKVILNYQEEKATVQKKPETTGKAVSAEPLDDIMSKLSSLGRVTKKGR